ncbi:919_t:CDS:10, partial [Ambispora gerdemannii]
KFNMETVLSDPQSETANYFPTDKFKKTFIAFLLLMQMYMACSFIMWKWWDVLSDRLIIFGFTIIIIYAVEIRVLFNNLVASVVYAKVLVIGFLSMHVTQILMKLEKEYSTMEQSGIFLLAAFRPYITKKEPLWFERTFYFAFNLILQDLTLLMISAMINEKEFIDQERLNVMDHNKKIIRETVQALSHELRTPIHGIVASSEFLGCSTLNDYQRKLVDTIQSSGNTLIQMADRVLTSLDLGLQGESPVPVVNFDSYQAMEEICDGMAIIFEKKNLDFNLYYNVPLSLSVLKGNVGIIKQIIMSLLGLVDSATTSRESIIIIVDSEEMKENEKRLLRVLFDIQAYGKILEFDKDTTSSSSVSQDRDNLNFTRGLVNLIGGNLVIERNQHTEEQQQVVPSLRVKLSIEFQINEDEIKETTKERPIPLRYLIKELPERLDVHSILKIGVLNYEVTDPILPESLNLKIKTLEMLQKDFGLSAILISLSQGIKIDENDKDSINTIIIDTCFFSQEQLMVLADTFSRKNQIVSVLFVNLLQQEKIYIIFGSAGFGKIKHRSIIKPITNVKLWNALVDVAIVHQQLEQERANQ